MPRFLLERLAAGPIDTAERHPVLGAWLLSDIAAFTAHVEDLAGRGTDGLEQVIDDFNRYFASVTSVVHRYGGDILTIAGDSFLCCWLTKDEGGIPAATVRAARAALSLQEAVTHPRVALPTRVGLAAGKATIGLVGGVRGRWELIPSGPAVADVLACEKDGPAGSVLVSAAALERRARRDSTVRAPDGWTGEARLAAGHRGGDRRGAPGGCAGDRPRAAHAVRPGAGVALGGGRRSLAGGLPPRDGGDDGARRAR